MKSRLIITLSLYFILNSFFIVIISLSNFEKQSYNKKKGNQSISKIWENLNSLVNFEKDLKKTMNEIKLATVNIQNFDGGLEIAIPTNKFFKADNIVVNEQYRELLIKVSESIVRKYSYFKINVILGDNENSLKQFLAIDDLLNDFGGKLNYSLVKQGTEDEQVHIIIEER